MSARTFVIAECCSSWRFGPGSEHLANAYKMISAAKEAGADAAKFQWCSDPVLMSKRRNDNEPKNYEILAYPFDWLEKLKAKCDEVGIEFMVTVFIAKDISKIAPLVNRFKIASAESSDEDFLEAHFPYNKEAVIVSYAFGSKPHPVYFNRHGFKALLCVCAYPTPVEQLNLARLPGKFDGLSDHTTSTLTGALAVAAGGSICEKHVRLLETPRDNPDFGHSLPVNDWVIHENGKRLKESEFHYYVENIREAELALGTGENREQPCEVVNRGRRVRI